MKNLDPEKTMEWLRSNPLLRELQSEFPEEWESVRRGMFDTAGSGAPFDLQAYLNSSAAKSEHLEKRARKGRYRKILAELASRQVRNRMAYLVVKQHYVSVATGIDKGKV